MFVNCLNFFSANQSRAFDFCVVCVSSWIQESDDNSSTRCTFVLSKHKLQLPEPYSICQRNSTGRIHDEWQTWKFVLRHITYVGCFTIFVVVEVWRNLSWSRYCHAESKFNKFLFSSNQTSTFLQPLKSLKPNFAGAETENAIAAGIINLEPDHIIKELFIEDLLTNFNGAQWVRSNVFLLLIAHNKVEKN